MTPGDRYRAVRDRVAEAAVRAGRRPEEVVVVAAAKTFGVEAIAAVLAAGATDVGENYVQEAAAKKEALPSTVRWHLIGRLQRNKARLAARTFGRIHSLDGVALAEALHRAASPGRPVSCLIEVNVGGEATKGGASPDGVEPLLEAAARLEGIRVDGLMCIPPPGDEGSTRRHFARLRALRDRLARLPVPHVHLKELSMGMSADFELAIAEGATIVRVGTAIFGDRASRR